MRMQPRTIASVALGAAGLATAAAGVVIGPISMLAYRKLTRPVFGDFGAPPPPEHLPHEPIFLTSRDGTSLAAWFIPGTRREAVLVLHGYGATKREMLHHAAFLHEHGYPVMLLDLRCCGESGGGAVTFGGREREDVAAALEYLQDREDIDRDRIGVLGLSLGGALALLAAAECPSVRAVVAESSFANIRGVVYRNFRDATRLPSFPFAPLLIWMVERRWSVRADRVAPEREIAGREDCALLLIHAENDTVV